MIEYIISTLSVPSYLRESNNWGGGGGGHDINIIFYTQFYMIIPYTRKKIQKRLMSAFFFKLQNITNGINISTTSFSIRRHFAITTTRYDHRH